NEHDSLEAVDIDGRHPRWMTAYPKRSGHRRHGSDRWRRRQRFTVRLSVRTRGGADLFRATRVRTHRAGGREVERAAPSPAFVLQTGDITQLAKADEFDTAA